MASYNPKKSIDTVYNYIQEKRKSGYTFSGSPAYDVTKSDLEALMKLTNKYGIPFEWMVNLIRHETGHTFNPAIRNYLGATGLIQFMTKISGVKMYYKKADGTGTVDTDALRKMNFKQQLEYVDGFLANNLKPYLTPEGKIPDNFTQGDLFMTIFYPVSVMKPNYVFPSDVPAANPGVYTPKDYTQKALNKAIFPLSVFPYSLSEFKEKFGEFWKKTPKKTKIAGAIVLVVLVSAAIWVIYRTYNNKKIIPNFK